MTPVALIARQEGWAHSFRQVDCVFPGPVKGDDSMIGSSNLIDFAALILLSVLCGPRFIALGAKSRVRMTASARQSR